MSLHNTFIPKHSQPFTLEQVMFLEIDTLVEEISRLQNSIAHLEQTQHELLAYLRDEPEGDDDGELSAAVRENEEVIASQTERIELIKVAMSNKVGPGAMSHYGLREKPVTPSSTAGAGGGTGGPSDVDGRGVHEGVNGPRGEAGEEARGESEEMGQVEHEGIHL